MRINITKFDGNSYYSQVGIPWLNPVGFHNWTQEEYSQHLDYLDSLMWDV